MAIDTPKMIRTNEDKLPVAERQSLYGLCALVDGTGLSIRRIKEYLDDLCAHCGDEAVITLWEDEYYGSRGSTIEWLRFETEAEVVKRIAANRKRQVSREASRVRAVTNQVTKDHQELARLQELYPDGVPS